MSSSSSTPTERIRDNAADFDFNSKITYRAYSVGRYKLNTERFSYIDLYEFVASKHKLVEENYRNHLLKPLDPVGISVLEEDSKIMILANPQYFAEKAAETGAATDYMLVPEKLIARRFMGAIATKWSLDTWLAKSAQDPNTVLIDRPVFGRTIIREIL